MLYEVTLVDGSKRTFDDEPEVGMAGELICNVDIETVDGLATTIVTEQVIFAPHAWTQVEPVVNQGEEE